jgi:hypothetical protein
MKARALAMEEIAAMGDAIAETAAMIDAAIHRFLVQLREFDEVDGWHRAGALSCAHWLSWRVGMDLGTAREKVRVAKRLSELPLIDEVLRSGAISYSKVRAMTRVATADSEAMLLEMARCSTGAQLEKICRLTRQVQSLEGADPKVEEDRRWVTSRGTDDGMVSIQLRLAPEEAARVMKALEVASGGGNLADGAVAMAELVLGGSGGGPVRSPVEVVVHVSAESLEGTTELGDGLPAEVSRRLLCDAGVVPMLEDGSGRVIDVGRKRRTVSSSLRRALETRDGGCRFPGCSNRRFVDAHHLVHWIDGGETTLENTLLVCRRHHRYLHEYGCRVERTGDELVFRGSDGEVIPAQGWRPADPARSDRLSEWLAGQGTTIGPGSNAPLWDGVPVDYDRCVAALF